MVRDAANYLLKQAHQDSSVPPPKVGDSWTKRFITLHFQYFKHKQEPLAAERDNAHDIAAVTKWFEAYSAVRTERGIADEDTWNMDETVSTHRQKAFRFVDPDNCDYISCAECISAGRRDIPPMIIL